MKQTRNKIAVLVGVIVCLTLLIFLGLFNMVIIWKIEREAIISIEQMVGYYDDYQQEEDYYEEVGYDSLYSVEEIYVPELKVGDEEKGLYYSRKQQQILQWCENHYVEEIQKVRIGNGVFFLQEVEYIEGSRLEKYIVYVDVTGEYEAVHSINILFVITAVIIGVVGSFFGYFLGKRIEDNELTQKRFFENTSHELKTPLTAIRGYAEGIETGVITDCKKAGRVIAAQTDRMSRLVEEILCMAKVEGGAMVLMKEDVDISEFVQDCLMPFEGVVRSKGLYVALDISKGSVIADPGQLEHAFTNILTNAIKYAKSSIKITYQGDEISVWNDGETICEDEIKHIFDRFYTGRNGSTGIGLALAKDIIELHDWRLTAEMENEGISFMIKME